MYKLKTVSLVCLFTVAAFVASCDEKEKQPQIVVENDWALEQTVFANQTSCESVIITTSAEWTLSVFPNEAASWISCDPKNGDVAETYSINISLKPNGTGEERTATITIYCNGSNISITITQLNMNEDWTVFVPVIGVTLSQTSAMLPVGSEPLVLTANVLPEDATIREIEWKSSNEEVVTVEDGVVTPLAKGTANITVTTID